MEFRLLGPVEVRDGGAVLDLGGGRQRAVLAALLLNSGRAVSSRELRHLIWTDPPASADSNLRTYMGRLRRLLHPASEPATRLRRSALGHVIDVADGELDVAVFNRLAVQVEHAAAMGEHRRVRRIAAEALALYRGAPFEGALVESRLLGEAARLEEQRRALELRLWRARIDLGELVPLIPELSRNLTEDPCQEQVAALLMLALYRSGRQRDALAVHRGVCERLAEDLGLDPGPDLRQLHRRILNADPSLDRCLDMSI